MHCDPNLVWHKADDYVIHTQQLILLTDLQGKLVEVSKLRQLFNILLRSLNSMYSSNCNGTNVHFNLVD